MANRAGGSFIAGVRRAGTLLIVLGIFRGAQGLEVVTPSDGLIVVADRTFTVEWTGASNSRFYIDLYYCGSVCMEDDCGEWVTDLCPFGAEGCPDNEGDYDVVMPEPLMGSSSSGYKVRVADVGDDSGVNYCSDQFTLMASEEAPEAEEPDGPYLHVTWPTAEDVLEAGDEYTVEFDYSNGLGSRVDRFKIDLYLVSNSSDSGDCGTWLTSICDKPAIGCKDSMGDYDVEIPEDTPAGSYSIRVGRFEDDYPYDCSDTITIVESGHTSSGSMGGTGGGSGSGSRYSSGGSASGQGSGGSSSSMGGNGHGSGEGYGGSSTLWGGDGSASGSGSSSSSTLGGNGYGSGVGYGGSSTIRGGAGSASGSGSSGEDGEVGDGMSSASGSGSSSMGGDDPDSGVGFGGSSTMSGTNGSGGDGSASGSASGGSDEDDSEGGNGMGSASGSGGSSSGGGNGSASGVGSSTSSMGSGSASGSGGSEEDDSEGGDRMGSASGSGGSSTGGEGSGGASGSGSRGGDSDDGDSDDGGLWIEHDDWIWGGLSFSFAW